MQVVKGFSSATTTWKMGTCPNKNVPLLKMGGTFTVLVSRIWGLGLYESPVADEPDAERYHPIHWHFPTVFDPLLVVAHLG